MDDDTYESGTYTVAYLCYPDADNVMAMGETDAEVADEAARAGLELWLYDTHGRDGSWYVECWIYDADGTPIEEVPVDATTVRQAFAPYTLTDKGVAALG